MADELNWDDINLGDEGVSEEDVKDAESMGKTPWGRFLCTCEKSTPKEAKFDAYTTFKAALKWCIDEALEIEGKKVEGTEGEAVEGKFVFDDIILEHPQEKDGFRKRRVLIANRLGLVPIGGKITTKTWSEDIIGKQAILITAENRYIDKKTKKEKVGSPQVEFAGYESPDKQETSTDSFEDI